MPIIALGRAKTPDPAISPARNTPVVVVEHLKNQKILNINIPAVMTPSPPWVTASFALLRLILSRETPCTVGSSADNTVTTVK